MHNQLKGILAGVYVLLIVLLLLTTCRHNLGEPPVRPEDIGQDGDIKITMLWDFPGDVDLHVDQPNGVEVSYMYPDDSENHGGVLDVDDREGGQGAAENIYWRQPMAGQYRVRVVYYRPDDTAPSGGPVRVIVKVNGVAREYNVSVSRRDEDVVVNTFDYPGGGTTRRQDGNTSPVQ